MAPKVQPTSDSKTCNCVEGMLGYNQTSNIVVEYANKVVTGAQTMMFTSGVEVGFALFIEFMTLMMSQKPSRQHQ